ncbi:MAG: response regulator [Limnochordia bacterium]|jgi:two-component system response regulator DegU|nr:response regulator transcription factor [Bacillota bacterium]
MEPIRVLIVDDYALFRQGLARILEMEEDIIVVGEAGNGREALELAVELRPHIILMDINMPVVNGLEATRKLHRRLPHVGIIGLTIHDDEEYLRELIKEGAQGYLLKDTEPVRVVEAIRRVYRGEAFLPPNLITKLFSTLQRSSVAEDDPSPGEELTPREKEVLCCIAQGMSNKEIAVSLYISEKTVKNHISSIFRKLDLTDRTQAAVYAIKQGLVNLD